MPRVQIQYCTDNKGAGHKPTPTHDHTHHHDHDHHDGHEQQKNLKIIHAHKDQPHSLVDNCPKTATAKGMQKVHSHENKLTEYQELVNKLKGTGTLYEDPDFPAETSSIFPSQKNKKFIWKRPKEIAKAPALFTEGVSRFDVKQGELGDCWVLAAVAALCNYDELFYQVVPKDQDFEENYIGAFYFRFWHFGMWTDVIVDDRLPVKGNRPIFMHSVDQNEFWSALLEKAYAKLNGTYENLVGGAQSEAMEDFTGGLCETIDLQSPPEDLFHRMEKFIQKATLMGCSVDAEGDQIEEKLPNGLLIGHAYTVTGARTIPHRGKKVPLIRVRNPWGNEDEWNGAWSDESPQWKDVSEADKQAFGLAFEDDGEFWMSYEDFTNQFTKLEVCHIGPENLAANSLKGKPKTKWEMCLESGNWQKNVNAGGCRNFLTSYWTNPQFRIEVVDPDEEDDEDFGTIIVGLMQKDMRSKKLDFYTIGYAIYKLKDPNCGVLDLKFFRFNPSVAKSAYINQREVCSRHRLPPGHYVIVPTTFQPNEEADFMMRVFSEKAYDSQELDMENTMVDVSEELDKHEKEAHSTDLDARELALKNQFKAFSGPRECINAYHLRDVLNTALRKEITNFTGFNTEVCRSMVAMEDANQTGKMEYDEFRTLWRDLRVWKAIFKEHDYDNNGAFDAYELRDALNSAGFKVSNTVFTALANRYADPERGVVSFEDFILCVVRLKNSFETYKCQPKDCKKHAIFNEEEYLRLCMYV